MEYTDLHTHRTPPDEKGTVAIHSLTDMETETVPGYLYSAGIHPWYIDEEIWQADFEKLRNIAACENIVAIGECGLDKLCDTPYALQERIFAEQAALAEELKKPLIIHAVKSHNDIIALHKSIKPSQQWIIHGFRGKPQTAEMLLREGVYISIGEKFNPELHVALPYDKLFVETDESTLPLTEIYASVAKGWGITAEQLAESTEKLFTSTFNII